MKRTTLIICFLLASGSALSKERNEEQAKKYTYCMRVAGVAINRATETGDRSTAAAMTQMRNHFALAAISKSDAVFVEQEIQRAVKQFAEDRTSGKTTFEAELDRCSELWLNEVRYDIGYEKRPSQ